MLLWRAPISDCWLPKVRANLNAVLVDHCHLERKAATSALALMKYPELSGQARELVTIAQEELSHFQMLMDVLDQRGVPFGLPRSSPWISGIMAHIRKGRREQVVDHLIAASLIEGRSCEKFQILAEELKTDEPEIAALYAGLVESEGNHYADFMIMARAINRPVADERLDSFLDLDAQLIAQPHDLPLLH